MSQRGNHLRKEVAAELERLGIVAVFGMTGGQHQYAEFYIGTLRRRYFFALTPSDRFVTKKTIAGVRRLARETQR
jgi:hypothetical protein